MYISKDAKIINKLGLHARASALFVKSAGKFQSEINVLKGSKKVNGKSIMGLLMLAAGVGSKITVEANGDDAEKAVSELIELINQGFHEK